MSKKIHFAFFGTPQFSANILSTLEKNGFSPDLVIAAPDKPVGRKHTITPPATKVWAQNRQIPVLQPKTLKDDAFKIELKKYTPKGGWDVFIVAAYAKLIPRDVFDIPKAKTLNVHPSLLPKLRGPSPIQSAILTENETGVTIMQIDEELDHGPTVAIKKVNINDWPIKLSKLEEILAEEGGKLLSSVLPDWVSGKIQAQPQDHSRATFTSKLTTADGLLNLKDNPADNIRKIMALSERSGAFFYTEHPKGSGKKIRVNVKDARLENGELLITSVVPEGRKEMSWDDFKRGFLP
ncbi:MAG: hypothetical protein A2653_02155 [Candidatus Zambryskibacteria bacterium RIFCSPHIGHO2_01_FULL_43_25]|uniref:methionyl-tRNA formyltransferase n=1 Tax=Candidatus Zambryskibacteria bacterium RIFCSPLOWO2_01_FULL_45_21 TaxID=1802761 RepID=A0A1G2U348_9BACT|nr:MAG: hypothetical protein A2653_02155 [Candidatus Zambryskibacteria bacterium RIFCSPHIGHO2_01_FULL_43_25]OHB01004.1 MAG: hypothetical protein A3E94_02335 [Candidatus Zambryskibacteria bacterium RIFCSPHIGHO2_12_FULL_44_12b]OHB03951.1 MAG: hypothetical protein A3B14_01295 [Candidatus Zambryskibacteria bacterium RIFCSPLOWO2_01_FULL_45_21]